MGNLKAVVGDGGRRCALLFSLFLLAAGLALAPYRESYAQGQQAALAACAPAIARVVSLQGKVEIRRANAEAWVPLTRLDTSFCAGDRLRTDALSRAGLYVQPETVVRVDQNTVIALNQSGDEIIVEFFRVEFGAQAVNAPSHGAGYFITRFPKKFKVKTPHMNAAVEGTEFMVQLESESTRLTVVEGAVS